MTLKSDAKFEEKPILLFQKWQEFGEFWSERSKVSKICTLIGAFRAKHTEESCKIWRKTDFRFGKRHEELGKFSPEHLKVSKLVLSWDPFFQSRKYMS